MFFLLGMSPGFYASALTNILTAKHLGEWVTLAFLVGPVTAIISPLIIGAVADQRMRAERLLGWISIGGGILLYAAFWTLEHDWNPWWFIGLLAAQSLLSGPLWGLCTTVALAHLDSPEKKFPLSRLGGTIGWMAAGLITSHVLHADRSGIAGYASVVPRLLLGVLAFALPATHPTGTGRSWLSLLGIDAFALLKERDHFVFFLVTGLLSIPLAAFYMFVPRHLEALGDLHASATMTFAQWPEVLAMLTIGAVMTRWRIKTVLMASLVIHVIRFVSFTLGGITGEKLWLMPGVVLHGVGYTFYFITAQIFLDRRVSQGMRGQAQGLLTLVSGGLGSSIGILLAGYLYDLTVVHEAGGWTVFWSVLTSILVLCLGIFAAFYKGTEREA
jgi:nucleoside transporter